jgi:hypothetical protein
MSSGTGAENSTLDELERGATDPAGSLLSGSAYFRVRRDEYSNVELGALV